MALSSHISHLTRHLGHQIGRGGCSLRGRVEAGGDFNFGLYHQGPNGAVITYFSPDPAPWPTDWTRWLLSQGRVEAAAVFKNSGENINMAPDL